MLNSAVGKASVGSKVLMANPVGDSVGIMLVGRKLFDGLALGLLEGREDLVGAPDGSKLGVGWLEGNLVGPCFRGDFLNNVGTRLRVGILDDVTGGMNVGTHIGVFDGLALGLLDFDGFLVGTLEGR